MDRYTRAGADTVTFKNTVDFTNSVAPVCSDEQVSSQRYAHLRLCLGRRSKCG